MHISLTATSGLENGYSLTPPNESHRLQGIREQVERANLFLREATESENPTDAFRRLMAAVYFARAALEIMRESAKAGELTVSTRELDARLGGLLPRYRLIKAIRIRDFHRFGVLGPGHLVLEHSIRL